ncbi:phospholipase D-like domain-containing protein [Anaerofustis sp. HA2171]|uniref:phospholipase D-like domain-containing protein n=1 Tax=Anaerofustis butyriciformans TaxID=3108533 RepID=UPI002E33AF9C|nr:phospholipase D-like domain-containing protein [Anaerofustis sp. HA2171]
MFIFTYLLKKHAIFAYVIIEIFSILVLIHLMADERNSAYKMLWIGIVLLLPIVGHIMYDLWGKSHSHIRKHTKMQDEIDKVNSYQNMDGKVLSEIEDDDSQRLSSYLTNYSFPPYKNNSLDFYYSGEETFENIVKDIKNAGKFIFISVFTLSKGDLFDKIFNILKQKASEGVEVKIMYDDVGSILKIPANVKKRLEEQGIEVTIFNAIHKNASKQYYNYRLHQKIIIIDGNISYTGGIDIKDNNWNNILHESYKDCSLKITGDATWSFTLVFIGMWNTTDHKISDIEKYRPSHYIRNDIICQPFADGPSNYVQFAEDMYKYLINTAKNTLYITTPCLNLDDEMIDVLCLCGKSGVDIRIVTPKHFDKKTNKYLSEFNFGRLLKNGVRIYEYNKGYLHSKIILNDFAGIISTINMNFRSFYIQYENGVFITDKPFIKDIKTQIDDIMKDCDEITYDEWLHRSKKTKIIQYILNVFKCQL